jgi:MYXO-CTERM domain-containing protein
MVAGAQPSGAAPLFALGLVVLALARVLRRRR